MNNYEKLKAEIQTLRKEGRINASSSPEERADWAYGTTKIENDAVTRAMAQAAVEERDRKVS